MQVNVNLESRPQGDMVEVLHLGMFPNGETTEVSDEQAEAWKAATGREDLPESISINNSGQTLATAPVESEQPAPSAESQPAPPQPTEGVTQ